LIRDGLNSNEKYNKPKQEMRDKLCGSIICKLNLNKKIKNIMTDNTIQLKKDSLLNLLSFGNKIYNTELSERSFNCSDLMEKIKNIF